MINSVGWNSSMKSVNIDLTKRVDGATKRKSLLADIYTIDVGR